jgi:hypothetical protein
MESIVWTAAAWLAIYGALLLLRVLVSRDNQ